MPGKHRWDGVQQFMKGLQDHLGFFLSNAFPVTFQIAGGAVVADFDGALAIADKKYEVVAVKERHAVAGTIAGTLMVKKVPSGTAKSAGTDVLASGINAQGVANTVQSGTLHATLANRQLAADDALGLEPSGAITSLDGVSVTVWVKALEK